MGISNPFGEGRLFAVTDPHSSVRGSLRPLGDRFAKVVRVPGNHELWIRPGDPVPLRGPVRRQRLAGADDPAAPLVLVNHFPPVQEATRARWHRHVSPWCGTVRTVGRHRRFHVAQVVYGHLCIPRITWDDGVRHREVSVGCPRERRRHGHPHGLSRRIAPGEPVPFGGVR